jgi:hypothetical protein
MPEVSKACFVYRVRAVVANLTVFFPAHPHDCMAPNSPTGGLAAVLPCAGGSS